jgi:hypothetical protein
MAQSIQPGRFGHSGKPDDAWLAKQEKESILEPDLPIIDTHHHLWDRDGWTYLLPRAGKRQRPRKANNRVAAGRACFVF